MTMTMKVHTRTTTTTTTEDIQDDGVRAKFNSYPPTIRQKMLALRTLIRDVAAAHSLGGSSPSATGEASSLLETLKETLKWGEPSYRVKGGSPIRIDWKEKAADRYAMYVPCQTTLVETFRELYADTFIYEGTRALIFPVDKDLDEEALKHCIAIAHRYHGKKRHLG